MATVLENAYPRARKKHHCDSCYRTIDVGETYQRQRGIADDPYVWKCCAHCRALYDWLWRIDPDAFDPDYGLDLRYWVADGGVLPAGVSEQFKAGWRDPSGVLMSVPDLSAAATEGDDK